MSNKVRGIILGVLGRLQKDITFDECHRNKTYYDGVKHGIKLSKKAIENIPKEELENRSKVMNEFKKCPFCGKNVAECCTIAECIFTDCDSEDYDFDSTHYTVICKYNNGGCGESIGKYYESEEEAIDAWNSRV